MVFWEFLAVFNLDLNIIFVMNSHTHSHLGMIFNEKLCRKNHTFLPLLPILAIFHYDLNIFLVMNSHTQLFFDFGMWGSKKSIDPDQGPSEQYESAVRILSPFFHFNHNQSRHCEKTTKI